MVSFKEITYKDAVAFLIDKHYSGRIPQIKYAYGMTERGKLVAVCTYGIPASRSLCVGLLGKEFYAHVIELNRLCRIDGVLTPMSKFVSYSLKSLKKYNLVVVSYADEGMNHFGTVYQASNFLYTGKTKQRTDKYTEGNKHSRHYDNNNNHLRKVRTSKHRYVYFACDKPTKKRLIKNLKYPTKAYPKGETSFYTLGDFQNPLIYNKVTGEYFHEQL